MNSGPSYRLVALHTFLSSSVHKDIFYLVLGMDFIGYDTSGHCVGLRAPTTVVARSCCTSVVRVFLASADRYFLCGEKSCALCAQKAPSSTCCAKQQIRPESHSATATTVIAQYNECPQVACYLVLLDAVNVLFMLDACVSCIRLKLILVHDLDVV